LRSRRPPEIWAASNGTLDWRVDPQGGCHGVSQTLARRRLCRFGGGDLGGIHTERAEHDFCDRKVEGFVTVSGDRHSFQAAMQQKHPQGPFEPVGVAAICGSIRPGLAEAVEHREGSPLEPLFVVERPGGKFETTIN
jgi:alkaline phosphatase D